MASGRPAALAEEDLDAVEMLVDSGADFTVDPDLVAGAREKIQASAWGDSLLAPVTDVVGPRDNRELFNFNLEESGIGQPKLAVDQYQFWLHPDARRGK